MSELDGPERPFKNILVCSHFLYSKIHDITIEPSIYCLDRQAYMFDKNGKHYILKVHEFDEVSKVKKYTFMQKVRRVFK